MEGFPDLLYLKRRTWPRQIPPTEMRLAKCQVYEYATALPQNPTYARAGESDYGSDTLNGLRDGGQPNRRTSSTSFVQSSMTCCGGSYEQMRMPSLGMPQKSEPYPDIALGCHHGIHRTYPNKYM